MKGLTGASAHELERLIEAVGSGRLQGPVSLGALATLGVTATPDVLESLVGLDARAAAVVAQAVLAERGNHAAPGLQLVWTGPEPVVSGARDTAVVVRDLFAGAQRSVLVAGFRFDHGAEILAPLHEAMVKRGVEATFFLNVAHDDVQSGGSADAARRAAGSFWKHNWTFDGPRPRLYYDPRTAVAGSYVSLHAKCVVVDERHTLVTSANFTRHGQGRNIEVGVLIDDPPFATTLLAQWKGAVAAGLLTACPE